MVKYDGYVTEERISISEIYFFRLTCGHYVDLMPVDGIKYCPLCKVLRNEAPPKAMYRIIAGQWTPINKGLDFQEAV
jgi:hypothetical protein